MKGEENMDKEKLQFFKELLLKKKKELLEKAEKTIESSISQNNEFSKDFTDQSTIATDKEFIFRLRDRERKLLAKIERCLEKIEEGTYGICERCGKEIDEKRLLARPVATLCIECKIKQEKEEKTREKLFISSGKFSEF